MRLAYADPPYLGCCGLYDHVHDGPLVSGCWDDLSTHEKLMRRLRLDFDGYVMHLSAPSLPDLLRCGELTDYRVMAWTKPFAAFKKNVSVAYAWEPVIVKAARKPEVTGRMVMRDFISEPITMKRGTTGAKPERVCHWAFECMGALPDDELVDLFPGSGAVSRAWDSWRQQLDFVGEVLTP
jgi:hypothetical protein